AQRQPTRTIKNQYPYAFCRFTLGCYLHVLAGVLAQFRHNSVIDVPRRTPVRGSKTGIAISRLNPSLPWRKKFFWKHERQPGRSVRNRVAFTVYCNAVNRHLSQCDLFSNSAAIAYNVIMVSDGVPSERGPSSVRVTFRPAR